MRRYAPVRTYQCGGDFSADRFSSSYLSSQLPLPVSGEVDVRLRASGEGPFLIFWRIGHVARQTIAPHYVPHPNPLPTTGEGIGRERNWSHLKKTGVSL